MKHGQTNKRNTLNHLHVALLLVILKHNCFIDLLTECHRTTVSLAHPIVFDPNETELLNTDIEPPPPKSNPFQCLTNGRCVEGLLVCLKYDRCVHIPLHAPVQFIALDLPVGLLGRVPG